MTEALFVANYIIEYCNDHNLEINNLRIQKLLYFINARNLVENGSPLFQDKIEKWKFGPVVPKVYHEYKRFGASTITKDDISAQIWKFNFEVSPFGEESPIEVLTYNKEEFSDSQIQLIESTILALKKYSTFKLVDLTHEDDMWKSDNQLIMSGEKGLTYDNNEIRDFFMSHIE
ncbi:TPA: DUF4065 domain-containing protein, partial [Streptococcus equi subsp. zooepidemicus]|nr:DUF4065 domain-containing protein [Streptococcus equi subsp. zooepidemicus]